MLGTQSLTTICGIASGPQKSIELINRALDRDGDKLYYFTLVQERYCALWQADWYQYRYRHVGTVDRGWALYPLFWTRYGACELNETHH